MADLSHAQGRHESGMDLLRAKCGWIVALGIVYVLAGAVALSSVAFATVVSVFMVGVMMLVAGVVEVIHAFQLKSWGKFLLWLALGLLYIAAGILTFENPLLTAAFLTLLLGASLVVSGIMRVFLAFSMKAGSSWFWVVLSGAITMLLGTMILSHWPVSGLYILGIFLGVDLVATGVGWLMVGLGLKSRTVATGPAGI
jgi:uncharacterized membrane protein HdeD (DUF308 family)